MQDGSYPASSGILGGDSQQAEHHGGQEQLWHDRDAAPLEELDDQDIDVVGRRRVDTVAAVVVGLDEIDDLAVDFIDDSGNGE